MEIFFCKLYILLINFCELKNTNWIRLCWILKGSFKVFLFYNIYVSSVIRLLSQLKCISKHAHSGTILRFKSRHDRPGGGTEGAAGGRLREQRQHQRQSATTNHVVLFFFFSN